MITKPTVFVLGAGASQPYGFKTAYGLLELVYASILGDSLLRQVLSGCDFATDEVVAFCRRMKGSGQYSIDAFIEREPRYLRIGKAAIALQLLLPEFNVLAFEPSEGVDWYRYLFARMAPRTPDDFRSNRLKVITFNFDHSFEWRLTRVLRDTYDISQEEAIRLAGSIPILHIHGELASDRPPVDREGVVRPHHPIPDEVMGCIDRIRIGREAALSKQVMDAHDWLLEAEVICFLGFSFNPDNLDKLHAAELGAKTLHATRQGMSAADVDQAYRYFNSPRQGYLHDCEVRRFFDVVNVFGR